MTNIANNELCGFLRKEIKTRTMSFEVYQVVVTHIG